MPLTISSEAITEKNKLADSGAWILLLEIIYLGEPSIRLCYNTEDIIWDSETWIAFPFKLDDLQESNTGEIPTISLTIMDIGRQISPLLDAADGGVGATVYVRIVHSEHLDVADAEFEESFEIVDVTIGSNNTITFKLGAENLSNYRSPPHRYLKGHCRYDHFKGTLCGYSGSDTSCTRTFAACRDKENQSRFGGFPGIGQLGFHL